jgi:hypothetical protein
MASTLYADNYSEPMAEASASGIIVVRPFLYTVTAALVVNDAIVLMPLQGASLPGFLFTGYYIDVPDLDTSTGLVLELGDSGSAARFVATAAAGSIGQVAGRLSSVAAVGTGSGTVAGGGAYGILPKSYTADDNLILTVQTAPTTSATSGVIRGCGFYTQWPIRTFS